MKKIDFCEEAIKSGNYKDAGINYTIYWAYINSQEAGTELLNFGDVIWEADIEAIVDFLKRAEIQEFTISCCSTSMINILAAFEKFGARIAGTTEVNAKYMDYATGEKRKEPAIKLAFE